MYIRADENVIPVGMSTLRPGASHFVYGVSPAMRALERVISDIAPTDIPVLLVGESGTGKEVVALEIHRRSRRRNEAFLKCNCAGLNAASQPAHLAAGENGREGDGPANSGTIFLDEVGQLDSANQSHLLQLLPGGDWVPPASCLGARVISATTRNLEDEMRSGRFREELYYRISGVCLRLPPLRHRKEDIPVLLDVFLKRYASLFGRSEPHLEPAAMNLLLRHSWPGNVRELENFARKVVALEDQHLALSDLEAGGPPLVAEPAAKPVAIAGRSNIRSLKEASREASRKAEREMILKALERTHWNRKRTARELQISYKALLYKLKQLGLADANDSPVATREAR